MGFVHIYIYIYWMIYTIRFYYPIFENAVDQYNVNARGVFETTTADTRRHRSRTIIVMFSEWWSTKAPKIISQHHYTHIIMITPCKSSISTYSFQKNFRKTGVIKLSSTLARNNATTRMSNSDRDARDAYGSDWERSRVRIITTNQRRL